MQHDLSTAAVAGKRDVAQPSLTFPGVCAHFNISGRNSGEETAALF